MPDYVVVGGGIVGLATAMTLVERFPGAEVVVLEKAPRLAAEQTGHNSGVVHAGVYYAPGTLKARLCREGAHLTRQFCEAHGIPVDNPGKLIVATDATELARMAELESRSRLNDLLPQRLSASELSELEPSVTGVGALLYRETGITDYRAVCAAMAQVVQKAGGAVRLGCEVTGIRERPGAVDILAAGEVLHADRLVVCGGIQSDRLARMAGLDVGFAMMPFRGEYYRLRDERAGLVRHLVYPVPDPALPFLGVHLTPMIDGSLTIGPNAVLGLAREGYRKGSVDVRDLADLVRFPGTYHVARANIGTGWREMRDSLMPRRYLERARRYCPSLELADLRPYPPGIRAQAVLRDGTFVEDFLFLQTDRILVVANAPSPAATSAIPIGRLIADRAHQPAARARSSAYHDQK